MKSDIDRLMQESDLDAIFVVGAAAHNPSMAYFTGRAHLTEAYLIKKRGEEPVLFCATMEREEGARTGLQTKDLIDYDMIKLLEKAGGDRTRAGAELFRLMFEDFGVTGKVALYGKVAVGPYFAVLRQLEQNVPGLELIGESPNTSILTRARATKSPEEAERIRRMGQITTSVFGEVAVFLSSHTAKDGVLVTRQGKTLTIGEVKRRINLWLAIRGAENPEGTIFAAGRDAGIPHSSGTDDDPVPVGKTIVFDLFPCEEGGGYYYDFTRTWCLGFASDDALQLHQEVLEVHDRLLEAIKPDTPCRDYQILTCQLFQEKGHPTILEDTKIQQGYIHSLGHGVGLAVHEGPAFSQLESNRDMVRVGSVFTVEPGLYYPERDMGVRIENTVWVNPEGKVEVLAEYPTDLVLKVPGV
ncbi:MAG: Xaa-Pro peptidase family protein [Anaerolineales bacterium]|jgi:Xaa-Pro aminopeptidase